MSTIKGFETHTRTHTHTWMDCISKSPSTCTPGDKYGHHKFFYFFSSYIASRSMQLLRFVFDFYTNIACGIEFKDKNNCTGLNWFQMKFKTDTNKINSLTHLGRQFVSVPESDKNMIHNI